MASTVSATTTTTVGVVAAAAPFANGSFAWCKYEGDGSWREAQILSSKQSQTVGKHVYYVHYVDLNRRMDRWIPENLVQEVNPDDPSAVLVKKITPVSAIHERVRVLQANEKERKEIVEFVEEEYGESAGMDAASIREHEEVTKIKNVNKIELGKHVFETWYYSPIPKEYFPDGVVELLYFSEWTLNFYSHKSELLNHYKRCKIRHPPGDEIYRDTGSGVAMFEVDGAKSRMFCQNLCYLAKFFLDHKTLHYDTEPFLFYVLCELDEFGYHIVGFFSKEKYSELGYNLACILTLPPYQKKGYGNFLIGFSYELSKKEGRVGSPEKPLSDLGQISYRSYWCRAILDILKLYKGTSLSVMDITRLTCIKTDDIILALNYLGLFRYDIPRWNINVGRGLESFLGAKRRRLDLHGKGEDVYEEEEDDPDADEQDGTTPIPMSSSNAGGSSTKRVVDDTEMDVGNSSEQPVIYAPDNVLEQCMQKLGGKTGPRVDPDKLHWAPLKVEVKRDKFSVSAKRRNRIVG